LIDPSFVYQQKGKENELVLGGMYKYVIRQGTRYTSFTERIDLSAGAFLRLPNDAIIPTFNFTYGNFAVGIAYDINISPLNEIDLLESFFYNTKIPTHKIEIQKGNIIKDCSSFIKSHLRTVKANNGIKTFEPYISRLKELKLKLSKID